MPGAADPAVLARTKTGADVLHYQNFSLRMHGQRRLALVTASSGVQSAFATVVVRQQVKRAQILPDSVVLTGDGGLIRIGVVPASVGLQMCGVIEAE